ncbi:hypothetical protein ARTSIC4J27_261 [Pseudarthrobacter siccitolerans]|uniref:Uncharacterized protein n=1 Tax=Pseudarthrobacter siccitolerans TaxID=861266 RepID=A0A024GXI6_9MICC|nr:hypothetical protein [Pseudarthrobacter siccitolerans]CCQ44337.1 hypothetical protein ARTSIC4J27_261 [Pseudarthrobacter siccitolerans]
MNPNQVFTHVDEDGDWLTVEHQMTDSGEPVAELDTDANRTVYVTREDAPNVALAILKAAGWEADALGNPVNHAVRGLAKYIEDRNEAKEAEALEALRLETEKLDGEALALLNAATGEHFKALPETHNVAKFWRAAAIKAREIHS